MVAILTGAGTGFERGSGSVLGGAGLLGGSSLGRNGEQLFLNGATGNLVVSQRDEFLVGRGPDAVIGRTYNSLGDLSDENGDNWRYGTDRRVFGLTGTVNTAGSSVQRVSGDGSIVTYSWNATRSAYVTPEGSGAYDTLAWNGTSWTWKDGDSQVTETYQAYGTNNWRIVGQADTDGNSLTFTYTADKLTRITTADGSYVDYVWSGNNITQLTTGYTDLATSTAKTLTRTRYSYDASNRLSSVTVDLSPTDNSVSDGKVYTTNYYYVGTSKLLSAIVGSDGSRIDIGYDGSNRVTSLAQLSSAGVTRTTTVSYGAGVTSVTDPLGQTVQLEYDLIDGSGNDGYLKKITMPPATSGAAQQVTQFGYDTSGNLSAVTDALGNVTSFTYDANGNALTTTDRLGNVVTRTYGAKNELLTETTTSSDSSSAAAAHTVRYAYDGENHLRYRVSAEGYVSEYRYTAAGELQFTIEYPEHFYDVSALASSTSLSEAQLDSWRNAIADKSATQIVENFLDARGNRTATRAYSIATTAGAAATTEGWSRTSFTYDQAGNLLARNVENRNAESFIYDGLGRLVSSVDVNGGTTSIVFDDANTRTVVTMANGFVQTSVYNKVGELVEFTGTSAGGTLTAATGTARYGYDQNGRLRWTQDATGRKSYTIYDQTGRKTADVSADGDLVEYRYDANNRQTVSIQYRTRLTSAQTATLDNANSVADVNTLRPPANYDLWTWNVYDKEGRLLQVIAGDGSTSVNSYDGAGRLIRVTGYANKLSSATLTSLQSTAPTAVILPTADASKDQIARTFHDKDGRLLGTLNGEGFMTKLVYDKAGQKIEEVAYWNPTSADRANGTFNQLIAGIGGNSEDRRTRFVYDGQGQLRFVVDAKNQIVETQYDAAGQAFSTLAYSTPLAAGTTDFTYDNVKALTASLTVGRRSWSVYDAAGRVAYAINAEGGVIAYAYNNMGQVTKQTEYAAARLTTALPDKTTMDGWASANGAASANRTTRNYYDGSGVLRYVVDPEGFVTRQNVDAEGRVTASIRYAGAISVGDSATTDTVYSLLPTNDPAAVQTISSYDTVGRLQTTTDGEGFVRRFEYTPFGLVSQEIEAWGTSDESITTYTYDNAGKLTHVQRAFGVGGLGVLPTRYQYDGLGQVIKKVDEGNNVTDYTYDKAGNVRFQADASGTRSYEYDAYGNKVKSFDPRGNPTNYYYDNLNRLVATADSEGYVTETSYTVFGQVASVTRRYNKATVSAATNVLPSYTASSQDATTSFEYDKLGRLTKTTDAMTFYEQYTLDAFGNRVTVRNKLGGTVNNTFDRRGLLLTENLPMESVRSDGTVQASTVTNTFSYDGRGNRISMTEASGLTEQRTTTYTYDKLNRLTAKIGGSVSVLSQSDFRTVTTVNPTESYVYDKRGNLIQTTDALGAKTFAWYDKLNRKTAEVGPLGTLRAWAYDANGNAFYERIYDDAVALPASPGGSAPTPVNASNYRQTSYSYDALNRLTSTSVASILVGSWNGVDGVAPTTVTISTALTYDANGNVLTSTDANGGVITSYYDKNNRKTAQVDQEGYLTTWTYDAEGNVLTERRYATRWTGTVTTSAPPATATSADDRVTTFTYDKNGRRKIEARSGVIAWSVSPGNGSLTQSVTTSQVEYIYNSLGLVTSKKEATGDTVTYAYDDNGRLRTETRSSYKNLDTTTDVTPTVQYRYDGLNNLSRTVQSGSGSGLSDRVTTYTYAAGGRLASLTDAAGGTHSYAYDAVGNMLRDSYTRVKSNGTSVTEGILYTRDVLGRITAQAIATDNGSAWVRGDSQNTEYNVFGEVTRRGINSLWQESFSYDRMGRVVGSNSGDGVQRFFVYDKNGNRTLTIESEGTNLDGMTVDQAIALARPGGGAAGAAFVDGINTAIAIYDKRNLLTASRLPQRELSTAGAKVSVNTSQTVNAFGEVASQTDARGNTTTFVYNTMGRTISKVMPQVSWTNESGVTAQASPTETYYYDLSGRQVGVRDANGNLNSQILLAGTGYGGSAALATAEYHADGGIARTYYDVFGDARILRNELFDPNLTGTAAISNKALSDETRSYDGMGRLTTQVKRGGLTEYYTYDLLGQRTKHWNSFLGAANVETTDYDLQGRVVSQVAYGGDAVTTSYVWSASLATSGLGTFGGWTKTDTYANGRTMVVASDVFGRDLSKTDMGGRVFSYAYDKAGRQTSRTTSGETLTNTWLNSGLVGSTGLTAGDYSNYTYDATGNKLTEYTQRGYVVVQNATATYDALNRFSSWSEYGGSVSPTASKSFRYDLNGNIRSEQASYRALDAQGVIVSTTTTDEAWYRYDSMNRVVFSDGSLVNGQITKNDNGTSTLISYNLAGQRTFAEAMYKGWGYVAVRAIDNYGWEYTSYRDAQYDARRRESFSYNADGSLAAVDIAENTYIDDGNEYTLSATDLGTAQRKGTYARDQLGRLTWQIDWLGDGTNAAYQRTVYYNAKGQISSETVFTKRGSDTYYDSTTNAYSDLSGNYYLGSVWRASTVASKNNSDSAAPDTQTTTTFAWYDGAVASQVAYKPNVANSTTYYTTNNYSPSGVLTSASISDGRPRTVTYTNDMNGQVVRRDESDNNPAGDPHEVWSRFNGREMLFVGNNGTAATNYGDSIPARTGTSGTGAFRQGSPYAAPYADIDSSYEAITSYKQGSTSGSYRARAGDTLQGIAQAVWGDSSLWYKLAEANGLSGDAALIDGQQLSLPAGVVRTKNNASTFKPYDASEAIGDLSPSTPKPPKKAKCGGMGTLLLAAVAIAVATVVTAGAAALASGATFGSAFSATLGGTLASSAGLGLSTTAAVGATVTGAVAGSIVSQGLGVATGLQDKFSWKGVALSALSAGIGQGLSSGGVFGSLGIGNSVAGSPFLGNVARGAAASAITQGVAVATTLQNKFSWAGVAAAGLSAGVSGAVGGKDGRISGLKLGASKFLTSGAGLIANATARSLIEGSSFGDNVLAGLPDVIAQTIGGIIQDRKTGRVSARAAVGTGEGAASEPQAGEIVVNQEALSRSTNRWLLSNLDWNATATYDFLTSNGISADGALAYSTSSELRGAAERFVQESDRLATFGPAVSLGGGGFTAYYSDGKPFMSFSGPTTGLTLLTELGRISNALESFKSSIHFDEVTTAVGFILGPAGAAKSLLAGLVGQAAVGSYVSQAQDWLGSKTVQIAAGISGDQLNNILNIGSNGYGMYAQGSVTQLMNARAGYLDALAGGKFAVSTLGAVILGGVAKGSSAAETTAARGAAEFPSSSFSISDWSGYPAGVPRPQGPFRILEGAEYDAARAAANKANATIRREQGLVGQAVDVHEIQPVKFGGSATDPANKIILDRNLHRQQVTPWWNQLQRDLTK